MTLARFVAMPVSVEFISQPFATDRIGDHLLRNLREGWTHFRAAVAFVKQSGTLRLGRALSEFARRSDVEFMVGIDLQGTSAEGLGTLLELIRPNGRVIVVHNAQPSNTFHPKIYLFKSLDAAEMIVGSGNLTKGGLFENCEAALRIRLNLSDEADAGLLRQVERSLDFWADTNSGTALRLTDDLLQRLVEQEFVLPEATMSKEDIFVRDRPATEISALALSSLFQSLPVRPAPDIPPRLPTSRAGAPALPVNMDAEPDAADPIDDDVPAQEDGQDREAEMREWWKPLAPLSFDDPEQKPARYSRPNTIYTPLPWPGTRIRGYRMTHEKDQVRCGVYLSGKKTLRETLLPKLIDDGVLDDLPPGTAEDRDNFWLVVYRLENTFNSIEEEHRWIAETMNIFVNAIRPRLKKFAREATLAS
jgi:HKD family nuclease